MLRSLSVILGILILLVFSFSGILLLCVPCVGLTVISAKFAYGWVNSIVVKWFQLAEIVLTLLFRMRIRTFGDKMTKPSFLFLSNHRCRLDWFFTMALGESVYNMKYSMKDPLRHIPCFGWAMQFSFFVFLKRNINLDRARIEEILRLIQEMSPERNLKLLFYPEGTDLSPSNLERNAKYAAKVGKEPTQYVLLPRITGFKEILKTLHEIKTPEVIYDITMGYPINIAQSEKDLITGNYPREVQFCIKEYEYKSLPFVSDKGLDEEKAGEWLEKMWLEKEARLKRFYELPLEERKFSEPEYFLENASYEPRSNMPTLRSLSVISFWLITFLAHVFLFQKFLLVKIYTLVMPVLFILADIYHNDGITGLFARIYSARGRRRVD